MAEEGLKKTENKLIHIGCPVLFDNDVLLVQLQNLLKICNENSEDIKKVVAQIVSTYRPAEEQGSEDKGEEYEAQIKLIEKA